MKHVARYSGWVERAKVPGCAALITPVRGETAATVGDASGRCVEGPGRGAGGGEQEGWPSREGSDDMAWGNMSTGRRAQSARLHEVVVESKPLSELFKTVAWAHGCGGWRASTWLSSSVVVCLFSPPTNTRSNVAAKAKSKRKLELTGCFAVR